MDLLIADNSVPFANADVAPTSGTPQWATDGNPATGVAATIAPAYHYNSLMGEQYHIVVTSGLTPNGADYTQVLSGLRRLLVQNGGGLNQEPINAQVIQLGLSTTSTALRATIGITDLGELAAFGNVALGNWMEKYSTLAGQSSETIALTFTAPRKGRVLVVASANLAAQATGNNLLSVAVNGATGSSDSVANTTSMTNHSCFEVAAGPVTVSSYFGISSSNSIAVGHTLSYLFVPE